MDNIIFIIFVILFIIVILYLNTKQEGFEPNNEEENYITELLDDNTITPSFLTTTPPYTPMYTNPSYITETQTPMYTNPSYITETQPPMYTNPSYIFETQPPMYTNPSYITETQTPMYTNPSNTMASYTTTVGSYETITPFGVNLSNTSMWFDPIYINYWTNLFAPKELVYKPYNVTLYKVTEDPDPNGIVTPTAENPGIVFDNYMKIAFDNTNSDYVNFTPNPIVSVQTKVKNIPAGNYVMTYYVSSSTNNTDTQSISITPGVNSVIGTGFVLRNFVSGGYWIKQQYAFSITDSASENTFEFQFELLDVTSPGFSIVALGGISIESCENEQCNIECTTYYTDWGVCDVTKNGVSTRIAEFISRNRETTCPVPLTTGNCLNAMNFINGLAGWNVNAIPNNALTNNSIKIPVFTPSTITNSYHFNVNNMPFNTPFVVVNFVNTAVNTFTGNINPTVTILTSLKLQVGNYRISYYIQSSEKSQLINVSSIIGNGPSAVTTQTIPSNVTKPLEWHLVTTNILVMTDSIIPFQFTFILKDTKPLINSAIALGGINISYCGKEQCSNTLPTLKITPYVENTTTPYSENTTTPYIENTTTPYSENTTTPYIEDISIP